MVRAMRCPRTFLLGSWLALVAMAGAQQPALPASKPEVRKEVVATIDGQLAAFRKHDVRKAYSFAAAALQAEKPLRVFAAIVQANYPEIWANARAEYGIVHDDGATATVVVHVFATADDASYDFTLVKERGGWRVHDVLRHDPAAADRV
jgi:hypothetical protein